MAHSSEHLKSCIDACRSCAEVCLETIQHCLRMGGRHAEPDHIRLMQDCVDICETSARFMIRGSALHTETCRVCALVCNQCADDCSRLEGAEMERCAEKCRQCAQECEQMAGAPV